MPAKPIHSLLFRAVADDAIEENRRAYQRAMDAIERADAAQREADLAYYAWEMSEGWRRD